MTITTNTKCNFTKAENDQFSWNFAERDFLTHKPTGKQIYQMMWYTWKNSQPITDQTIKDGVIEFWAELRKLQDEPVRNVVEEDSEPAHGENGYCRKCHTYCFSDCEA